MLPPAKAAEAREAADRAAVAPHVHTQSHTAHAQRSSAAFDRTATATKRLATRQRRPPP